MGMNHSIFAMELCLPLNATGDLCAHLRHLVRTHPDLSNARDKWALYREARRLIRANLAQAVSGCWDFFDSDSRARSDYDMWSNGMITEEGARKQPSGTGDPYRGDFRYLTFTMSFLMVYGTPSERRLCAHCNIPENRLWLRQTFDTLLAGLGELSFASVKSDVIYVIPGDDQWGLTAEDLRAEKFHYLRPLQ